MEKQYKNINTGYMAVEDETNYKVYTEKSKIFVTDLDKKMIEESPDWFLVSVRNENE